MGRSVLRPCIFGRDLRATASLQMALPSAMALSCMREGAMAGQNRPWVQRG